MFQDWETFEYLDLIEMSLSNPSPQGPGICVDDEVERARGGK